jgi:hypothetical protein
LREQVESQGKMIKELQEEVFEMEEEVQPLRNQLAAKDQTITELQLEVARLRSQSTTFKQYSEIDQELRHHATADATSSNSRSDDGQSTMSAAQTSATDEAALLRTLMKADDTAPAQGPPATAAQVDSTAPTVVSATSTTTPAPCPQSATEANAHSATRASRFVVNANFNGLEHGTEYLVARCGDTVEIVDDPETDHHWTLAKIIMGMEGAQCYNAPGWLPTDFLTGLEPEDAAR